MANPSERTLYIADFVRQNPGQYTRREIATRFTYPFANTYGRLFKNLSFREPPERIRHWSNSDKQYLRENFNKLSLQTIADRLGRTRKSTSAQSCKMKLRPKKFRYSRWTPEQIELLMSGKYSYKQLVNRTGRTYEAICRKAVMLGITYKHQKTIWTAEQLRILRETRHEEAKVVAKLVGHTWMSVHSKRSELGLLHRLRWTPDEIDQLIALHLSGVSIAGIAIRLGRTERSVPHMLTRLRKGGQLGTFRIHPAKLHTYVDSVDRPTVEYAYKNGQAEVRPNGSCLYK